MKKIDGRTVTFKIPHDLLAELDELARKTGKTRNHTMRACFEYSIDTYKDMEKLGVVGFVNAFTRAKKAIRERTGQLSLF